MERDFLDFVVDGQSLFDVVGRKLDSVSCLAWFPAIDESVRQAERLLLRQPAELADGRRSLYVCGECGDLGCGAITVVVQEDGDKIVWSEFGRQNDRDEELDRFDDVGPFVFNKNQYVQILEEGIRKLKETPSIT